MDNNQHKGKNKIYQYTASAASNINYNVNIDNGNNTGNKVLKTKIQRFEPGLQRARKALQLVNPFKGV